MHSLISRCLILGSLFAVLVTASARHPSAGAMAAFVHPKITTHGRGGIHESSSSSAQPHRNSRTRGERVKGVNTAGAGAGGTRLFMAPAKKQVAKKKTTEVESFKKSEFVASISEKTGFTRAESEEALTAVLDTLTEVRTCVFVLANQCNMSALVVSRWCNSHFHPTSSLAHPCKCTTMFSFLQSIT